MYARRTSSGGDADLQRRFREFCIEFKEIFSDSLPHLPADLEPFEIHVDKTKWESDSNRSPMRPQSKLKMEHIKKHIDSMLAFGIIEPTRHLITVTQ